MTDKQRVSVFNQSIKTPIPNIAEILQRDLGQRLVAYAVGTKSPKAVGRWALGRNRPGNDVELRLRLLYRVHLTLGTRESADVIRAWLVGSNPDLEDCAPIESVREGSIDALYLAENFIDA